MGAPPELIDLLGGDDVTWLRDRVRRRLQRGRPLTGVTSLARPTAAQIAAVATVLGRPFKLVKSLAVDLTEVDVVISRSGLADGLGHAVQLLDGPVSNVAAQVRQRDTQWEEVNDELRSGLRSQRRAALPSSPDESRSIAPDWAGEWAERMVSRGLLKRFAGGDPEAGRSLVRNVLSVLAVLPAAQLSRSRFAAEVLGDAHALDSGPLAHVVRSALNARFGAPMLTRGEGRIETWAAAGVLIGDLTSTVLVAGFESGPRVWTLRQVARREVDLRAAAARTVWVVENPTVVAEAVDAFDGRCPPMICASGQPTVAVLLLLRGLAKIADVVAYHGDFDWDGVAMTNRMIERLGVTPWRMSARDYRMALREGRSRVPLRDGREVQASWDGDLAPAMRGTGLAVEEEAVLDRLLEDLGNHLGQ